MPQHPDPQRIAVLADVEGGRHLGDEAMLKANVERLRASWPDVAITTLGRTADARALLEAVAASDAVVVSGGGNLSDTWPALVEQRLTFLAAAAEHGRPAVVLGQSLGPNLSGELREAVAAALRSARLVGVRDPSSVALAEELGLHAEQVVAQVDDAFWLDGRPPTNEEARDAIDRGAIVVSLDEGLGTPEADRLLAPLAMQLAYFAAANGLEVLVVPHVGIDGDPEAGDLRTGHALARQLALQGVRATVAPMLPVSEAQWLTARARLVVSSRYHALVFASSAAVPAIGLHADPYTEAKIVGALGHVGAAEWALGLQHAADGALLPALEELTQRHAELAAAAAALVPAIQAADTDRWSRVEQALRGAPIAAPTTSLPHATPIERRPEAPTGLASATRRPLGGGTSSGRSDAEWATFARDGYLPLGQVLDTEQVEALKARADALALGKIQNPAIRLQADSGGAYEDLPEAVQQFEEGTELYRKIQGLEFDDAFIDLVRHPRFLEVGARLYGPHVPLSVFRAMVMNKPAGRGTHLPWHQDGGDVWQLDREPLVTIWVALDPATIANGCMECIPGSHQLGLLSSFGSTVSDEDARRYCPPERVTPLEVPAGHAVLLHNWLIHRSGVNPSPIPRRAVTICYLDGRSRSLQTGRLLPVVAGYADPRPGRFVEQLQIDLADRALAAEQSAQYAASLLAASREAERYAQSLEEARRIAEEYARSLEAAREGRDGSSAPVDTLPAPS